MAERYAAKADITMKTAIIIPFWREKLLSTREISSSLFTIVLLVFRDSLLPVLRDNNAIAGSQQDILFQVTLNDRVVVDDVLGYLVSVSPDHPNITAVGENPQPTHAREKLQNRLIPADGVRTSSSHLSHQKNLSGRNTFNSDCHERICSEFFVLLFE